jgi:colanic acid/amylovoran biosynthesis protein
MKKQKHLKKQIIYQILIVNVHSSKNAGDYALLLQTIYYLEKAFGKTKFSIMANWPKEKRLSELDHKIIGSPWWEIRVWDKNKKPRFQIASFLFSLFFLFAYKLDRLNLFRGLIPKKWVYIFNEFSKTDLVVAVAGNQLFTSGRKGWPLTVVGLPIFLAKLFKKKTIIFPQSIGPLKYKFDKKLVRFLYQNVDQLFVRDLVSLKLVRDLTIYKSNPCFMHDVAFTFPAVEAQIAKKVLASYGYREEQKTIGLTILSSMPSYLPSDVMQNYYQCFADMITSLVDRLGYSVFVFCQVYGPTDDENDFIGIETVRRLLPDSIIETLHIINKELHPSLLKACYGLMDVFIASRLHSGIFSLGMRVPTLFVGYLHKTFGVLKALQMTDQIVDLEEVTEELLLHKVSNLWENRSAISERINSQMLSIEKDLDVLPERIQKVIDNYEN